jgi:ubiquitin C-terminal hydrolase
LLFALSVLFDQLATRKISDGSLSPISFIRRLRKANRQFDSGAHQDAQEFLIFLLNDMNDTLKQERKEELQAFANGSSATNGDKPKEVSTVIKPITGDFSGLGSNSMSGSVKIIHSNFEEKESSNENSSVSSDTINPQEKENQSSKGTEKKSPDDKDSKTWIEGLFGGELSNVTECARCGNRSESREDFFDLSLTIRENTSITACLKQFTAVEVLCGDEKYVCDNCDGTRQEAFKSMHVKVAPDICILHIKRFEYSEKLQNYTKLNYRIAFPMTLRLIDGEDDYNTDPNKEFIARLQLYHLFAVVVHIGSGIRYGHYICVVKMTDTWYICDDDKISPVKEEDLQWTFGSAYSRGNQDGYLLFYTSAGV